MHKRLLKWFALAQLVFASSPLWAWFEFGHQVVCEIAWRQLPSDVQVQVSEILGGRRFVHLCSWADFVKFSKEWSFTYKWHFVDVGPGEQIENTPYKSEQEVENVVQAMNLCEDKLSNPNVSNGEKATYLKFLGHFAGDIHQPMHTGNRVDRGGNEIKVTWFGKRQLPGTDRSTVARTRENCKGKSFEWDVDLDSCIQTRSRVFEVNLHSLWDGYIIDKFLELGADKNKTRDQREQMEYYTKFLIDSEKVDMHRERGDWHQSKFVDWARESNLAAINAYKTGNGILGQTYYNDHIAVVNNQLARAGERLAFTIAKALRTSKEKEAAAKQIPPAGAPAAPAPAP